MYALFRRYNNPLHALCIPTQNQLMRCEGMKITQGSRIIYGGRGDENLWSLSQDARGDVGEI
jgi:hypothetical protein